MKFVLLYPCVDGNDSIGMDIRYIYHLLNRNHECYIYCSSLQNSDLPLIHKRKLMELIYDENNLIIYHYYGRWDEGELILQEAKSRIIFKRYSNNLNCTGLKKNKKNNSNLTLQNECMTRLYGYYGDAIWFCDSLAQSSSSEQNPAFAPVIIPPFDNIAYLNNVEPDDTIIKGLIENDIINLLYAGSVLSGEGLRFAVEIVKNYIEFYGNRICLHIVDSVNSKNSACNNEITALIKSYKLSDNVRFINSCDSTALLSYYLGCDLFLCCDEREHYNPGLVAAHYLYLPVIARKTCSASALLGPNQLLLSDTISEYSSAVRVLYDNDAYKEYLVTHGADNYKTRFANESIEKLFTETIEIFAGVSI
jgi:glycosyltransferase involved in cell wall biosynthesis